MRIVNGVGMEEKIEIADWFNVYSKDHLMAYRTLESTGSWPKGFIPENVRLPPGWQMQLFAKMAGAWMNMMAR